MTGIGSGGKSVRAATTAAAAAATAAAAAAATAAADLDHYQNIAVHKHLRIWVLETFCRDAF